MDLGMQVRDEANPSDDTASDLGRPLDFDYSLGRSTGRTAKQPRTPLACDPFVDQARPTDYRERAPSKARRAVERVGHRELIVVAGGDGRVAQRAAPQTEHQVADDDQAPANPVLEAGAAAIPIEVLEQAKALTAALPEAERDRLLVWFTVRMIGSIGMIGAGGH